MPQWETGFITLQPMVSWSWVTLAREGWMLNFQELCGLVSNTAIIRYSIIDTYIEKIILKTKVINTTPHFLIILLSFTFISALIVIYVYCICTVKMPHYRGPLPLSPNATFSDITLAARNGKIYTTEIGTCNK